VDLDAVLARHPAVRYCLDWSEQQHHLAGPLGTALADRSSRWTGCGAPIGAGWSGSPRRAGQNLARDSWGCPVIGPAAQLSRPLTA